MLGETVRESRIKQSLTQAKLARLAGVSRRHLAALENGANVSVAVLRKVAAVLELRQIQLGELVLATEEGDGLNVPLLAETIREAREETRRTEAILARAQTIIGHESDDEPRLEMHFPKLGARRVDTTPRKEGADAVQDRPNWLEVRTSGELQQGKPVDESRRDSVIVPATLIEKGELVFRVRGGELRYEGIEDGDLLVAEVRSTGRAATGELVIARSGDNVFVGRWWQKHGMKALMSDGMSEVTVGKSTRGLKVLAAVNQVIRPAKREE